MSFPGSRTQGFTLIEVIIVLGIISILLGLLAPLALQLFTAERTTAVENEVQTIYQAIVGDPKRGVFGFVGDVGGFPNSLSDLVVPPTTGGAIVPGWRGPYLGNPRIETGILLDPFNFPFEYFLKAVTAGPDQLAIIGRGPDGLTTNTATNPNGHSAFAGPFFPLHAKYFSNSGNADNVVFPRPSLGNQSALDVEVEGDVGLNILNFDANPKVNAFVPACPELFTITATSIPRGLVEPGFPLAFVPGLQFSLTQGQYRAELIPKDLASTAWTETITVLPATMLTRTINLTGLDSSGTRLFNLTVINSFTNKDVDVFEFDVKLKTTDGKSQVKAGETKVFTPHACAQIFIREHDKSTVVDQFAMPYNHSEKVLGTGAACLTVVNLHHHPHDFDHPHDKEFHHHHHHGHHRLLIFLNDILLGTVKHDKKKTFCDLRANDIVTIKDKEGTLLEGPFPLMAPSQTKEVL